MLVHQSKLGKPLNYFDNNYHDCFYVLLVQLSFSNCTFILSINYFPAKRNAGTKVQILSLLALLTHQRSNINLITIKDNLNN